MNILTPVLDINNIYNLNINKKVLKISETRKVQQNKIKI